jgi:competence protein ComGC
MERKTFLLIVGLLIPFIIGLLLTSSSKKKEAFIISQYIKQALSSQDQAKLKMIESAVAQYEVEKGHSPDSLEDLVAEGYISAKNIVDHKGNKLAYTPKGHTSPSGSTTTTMSKSCGRCGKRVSNSSKVGGRCPHCGVVWGSERVTKTY